ncbi:MAG: cobalamin biosynthesis protein [Desulfurococcaceae archaeon]|nr:cobalamin biosynthesis protein [Desulfurococcaceae archaeon]
MKLLRWPIVVVVLILISPLFGIYLADLVKYHEPLDIAIEMLGLEEWEDKWPLKDYSIPGLDPYLGYIASGFIGAGAIALTIFILDKALTYVGKRRS